MARVFTEMKGRKRGSGRHWARTISGIMIRAAYRGAKKKIR
jgi:hypothetical protein